MQKLKKTNIPLTFQVLKYLVPEYDRDYVYSDFENLYESMLQEKGKFYARFWIFGQIVRSIPGLLAANFFWRYTIFISYLKVAIRNLKKHKSYSIINITGLAIGIAACILIFQYVSFELSYDNFHEKGDNIYRIRYDAYSKGKLQYKSAASVPALGPAMKSEFPEVEEFARITINWGDITVFYKNEFSKKEISFRHENVYYADASFFKMFTYPFMHGDPNSALKEPFSVVISEKIANRYFNGNPPIGKRITINSNDFKLTGVFKDVPRNSHLKFDIVLDLKHFRKGSLLDWHWDDFYTYVLLKKNISPQRVESKFPQLLKKHSAKTECLCFLQSIKDIHLYSNLQVEPSVTGNSVIVHFLLIIAVLILIIAWINYINLSTARSLDRAKEAGLRKVSGATRWQIVRQFLLESFFTNIISVVLAVLAVKFLQNIFERQTENLFSYSFLTNTWFGCTFFVLITFGMFITGFYPALLISSFNLTNVLKGKLKYSDKGALLRKGLVVFQFSASIILLTGTLIVFRQLSFMRTHDLGLNMDNTLVLKGPQVADSLYNAKYNSFKTELLRLPGIESMTASIYVPGREIDWTRGIRRLSDGPNDFVRIFNLGVDHDFIDAFDVRVIAGRAFTKEKKSDEIAVVLNMAAVELLGYNSPSDALNQKLTFGSPTPRTIIGVVENYFQLSMKKIPGPFVFHYFPYAREYYSLKVKPTQLTEMLPKIKILWDQFFPGNPFDYFFLDEYFDQQYKQDERLGQTFAIFAFLAILLACLGLFGLSSFMTIQRTKEIGIRKVMGARLVSIIYLFSKEFIILIIISAVISFPLFWFGIHMFLQSYPFRINVQMWHFIVPLIITIIIAFGTVGCQILKVARANPVEALRYE